MSGFNREGIEQKESIWIFLPESMLDPHGKTASWLADKFSADGYQVVLFTCFGDLDRCFFRSSVGNPVKAYMKCKACHVSSFWKVGLLRKAVNVFQRKGKRNLRFIPILKKFAEYDTAILRRVSGIQHYSAEDRAFHDNVVDVSSTLVDRLIFELERVDFKVSAAMSFDEYCYSQTFRFICDSFGVRTFQISYLYAFNYRANHVYLDPSLHSCISRSIRHTLWNEVKDIPLPARVVEYIFDDLEFRFSATWGHAFSVVRKNESSVIRKMFQGKSDAKVVSFLMSSEDEFAAISATADYFGVHDQCAAFDSQEEMLRWLVGIDWSSLGARLVVRFHPRVLGNEGFANEYYKYMEILDNVDSNFIFVDPPSTEISAYDLGLASDLVLVSWSTIGLELAKLGVPVVCGVKNRLFISPDLELLKVPTDNRVFESIIKEVCERERRHGFMFYSIQEIVEVVRWHYLHYLVLRVEGPVGREESDERLPSHGLDELLSPQFCIRTQILETYKRISDSSVEESPRFVEDETSAVRSCVARLRKG